MPLMRTNGVANATKEFVDRARSIVRLEIELALLEIKTKLTRIGVGIGLAAGAGVIAVFAVGFLLRGRRRCARARVAALGVAADRRRHCCSGSRPSSACWASGRSRPARRRCPRRRSRKRSLTTQAIVRWPLGRPAHVRHEIESERKGLERRRDTLRSEAVQRRKEGRVRRRRVAAAAMTAGRRTRFPPARAGEEQACAISFHRD